MKWLKALFRLNISAEQKFNLIEMIISYFYNFYKPLQIDEDDFSIDSEVHSVSILLPIERDEDEDEDEDEMKSVNDDAADEYYLYNYHVE